MATRCYAVRDAVTYESFLHGLLDEMFGHSARIFGPGSAKRFLLNQFWPRKSTYDYSSPMLAVERASLNVIERQGLKLQRVESIGLRGLAGTFDSLTVED
jgi:hypothetical protein